MQFQLYAFLRYGISAYSYSTHTIFEPFHLVIILTLISKQFKTKKSSNRYWNGSN